jgi:hypothetical protein
MVIGVRDGCQIPIEFPSMPWTNLSSVLRYTKTKPEGVEIVTRALRWPKMSPDGVAIGTIAPLNAGESSTIMERALVCLASSPSAKKAVVEDDVEVSGLIMQSCQ